jgi:SAM-dependent methyltransferase
MTQMTNPIDQTYWEKRWQNGETGWDIGSVSTPLKAYIDQLENRNLRILIPGCGNSYEAEYLWSQGFLHTDIVDYSPLAIENFQKRVPFFPKEQIYCLDFFEMKGSYDLILEQTFFCALDPGLRQAYALQMHQLLAPGGKLVGLLFDETGNTDKPPFGGTLEEYKTIFSPLFEIKTLERAYNSIPPRAGRELFLNLNKVSV